MKSKEWMIPEVLKLLELRLLVNFLDIHCKSTEHPFFFYHGATAPVGQGLLIIEGSWSHSDTPHSLGFHWTSDKPNAETSTWQHTTLTTYKHPCLRRDRTHNPSKRTAADLRSRGYWDWLGTVLLMKKSHSSRRVHISISMYRSK